MVQNFGLNQPTSIFDPESQHLTEKSNMVLP